LVFISDKEHEIGCIKTLYKVDTYLIANLIFPYGGKNQNRMETKKSKEEEFNQKTNNTQMDKTTQIFIVVFILIFIAAIIVYNLFF
jgi:preprotein translocase subunit SecG